MSTTDDGAAAEVAFDPTKPAWMKNGTRIHDLTWIGEPHNFWRGLDDEERPWLWHTRDCVRDDDQFSLTNVEPAPVEPAGDPVRLDGAWRPIETAPKDGTPILVAEPSILSNGQTLWYIDVAENHHENDYFGTSQECADKWTARESSEVSVCAIPTHWMPLPSPPGAAPQPDSDLETAITTLLAQVGSSHEAYPGAKRDLVRAFVARHGTEARGKVGAGEDAVLYAMNWWNKERRSMSAVATRGDMEALADIFARRGARASVAGGEPKLSTESDASDWQDVITQRRMNKLGLIEYREVSIEEEERLRRVAAFRDRAAKVRERQAEKRASYRPPAPPAPTAERDRFSPYHRVIDNMKGGDAPSKPRETTSVKPDLTGFDQAPATEQSAGAAEPPHGHQAPPAAPVGGVSDDPEQQAWAWMHKFTDVEAGHDPSDRDYCSDDMIDAFIAGLEARPTPDDGCPKGYFRIGGNGDCHNAGSTFAERGAVEAAVAAETEPADVQCPYCGHVGPWLERPTDNSTFKEGAEAMRSGLLALFETHNPWIVKTIRNYEVRSRASTPAAIDGLAPGGRDGTEG